MSAQYYAPSLPRRPPVCRTKTVAFLIIVVFVGVIIYIKQDYFCENKTEWYGKLCFESDDDADADAEADDDDDDDDDDGDDTDTADADDQSEFAGLALDSAAGADIPE